MSNKLEVFNNELSHISDAELKAAVEGYFENAVPDYFWTIPASTTGKYHPDQDAGEQGLVRHSRMVTQVAISLMMLEMWQSLKPIENEIYVACLIHDTWKLGKAKEYVEGKTYTAHDHPLYASHAFYEYINSLPDATPELKVKCQTICQCVETHMGQWNVPKYGKACVLKKPQTPAQKFVHLCDYIASRNFIGNLDKLDGK